MAVNDFSYEALDQLVFRWQDISARRGPTTDFQLRARNGMARLGTPSSCPAHRVTRRRACHSGEGRTLSAIRGSYLVSAFSWALTSVLRTLPTLDRGRSGQTSTCLGALTLPSRSLT
jgi:hypothetical protein